MFGTETSETQPAVSLAPTSIAPRSARTAVVVALTAVATFNVIDRQILAILLEPIRRDLDLSDAQLGLLTGFAFVVFYAVAGVPIARFADRHSRRGVILVGLTFWSVMTALAGFATTFIQLVVSRIGLGIGEASSGPATHSLLSELYEPERRAPAFSWIAAGVPLGALGAFAGGGHLEAAIGWRATLVVLGALGVVLAGVVAAVVREPPCVSGALYVHRPTRALVAELLATPAFRWLLIGTCCNVVAASVMLGWSPAFFVRVHGVRGATAGAWLGAAAGIGGLVGTLLGGNVAQKLAQLDRRWWLGFPAVTNALAAPMLFLFLSLPTNGARWAAFGVLFFGPAMLGPVMTVTQGIAAPDARAFAAAFLTLVYHLVGWGLGPLIVGAVSDALMPRFGVESLRYAMGLGIVALLASATAFARGARFMTRVELH